MRAAREDAITRWAMDLGTCNTAVCRWNEELARPELVELPGICRIPGGADPMEAPLLIPSATHMVEDPDFWTRLCRRRFFARRFSWGREGWIGRQALERNLANHHPAFVPTFKGWLGRASTVPIAKMKGRSVSAREVAATYLRELFAEVHRTTGERIRDLVITAPVESFESYRAEVAGICKRLGVDRLRFADEPVAAALGYGLSISARKHVLVMDFGAGTLDLALVRLTARDMEQGRCEVLAKAGRPVGGDHVDNWLLDDVAGKLGVKIDDFWRGQLLDEARRVKETSYVQGREIFHLHPPELGGAAAPVPGVEREIEVDQAYLREVCDQHGLFDTIRSCVDELAEQASAQGFRIDSVDDVLMVGGSTLLPGVYPLFEKRFGRDRVRSWRPFEAVAWGATALAAEAWTHADFIVHEYAILTYDGATGDPRYLPIIERGTRFPTREDHWRNQFVPTCALGEPETIFKLVVCEMGTASDDERLFGWDAQGEVHTLRSGDERLIVPLNESAPALGTLDPPHPPSDRRPRLDVAFGINADRWLIATVRDLHTSKTLMDSTPVVRLL